MTFGKSILRVALWIFVLPLLQACKAEGIEPISSDSPVAEQEIPLDAVENDFTDDPDDVSEGDTIIPGDRPVATDPFLYQVYFDPEPIPDDVAIPDFENPIVAKLYRLSGGTYEIPVRQMREIERAEEPAKVAQLLEQRILSFRQRGAEALNIDIRHIGLFDVLPAINMQFASSGYGNINPASYLQQLGYLKSYEIGKRVGLEHKTRETNEWLQFNHPSQPGRIPAPEDNPIVVEINRITKGEYVLSHQQTRQVQRASEPHKVADWLEQRILSYRQRGSEALEIDIRFLPTLYVLGAVNLEFPANGYGQISKQSYLHSLGGMKSFEIGYRKGLGDWY